MIDISLRVGLSRVMVAPPPVATEPRRYWFPHDTYRVDYDADEVTGWRYNPRGDGPVRQVVRESGKSRPQVYRIYPLGSLDLKKRPDIVKLFQDINPELVPERALSVFNVGVDYCNTRYMLLDQFRICGGAILEETHRDGNRIYYKTVRADRTLPRAADVLADPSLWHWVTSISPRGNIYLVNKPAVGGGTKPVRMLNLSREPAWVLASWVLPLEAGFVPGPTWKPEIVR